MPTGQKRGSDGRFKEMPRKASRVSNPSPAKSPPRPMADVGKPQGKGMQRTAAPTGHVAEGVQTLQEYIERVRNLYASFRRLARD
jgi:hypothetical protein